MSQPPQPPPPPLNAPTINPPILQQSLTSLYPLSEILQRLHHRNKNQHSSSLWYSSFDILRRNVAKLVSEIETCLDNAPPEGDNRKVNKVRAEKARKWDHQGVEKVRKRAGFVKHEMVKGCWVRFGGLVGDRQFAQVGLVLMGVLGGVNTVVQGLVGEEGGTEGEGEEIIREGGRRGR
ncbi:hypothetical protein B0T21DRAFT_447481 [Apiosordaria backusii]|uniref:RNase MRP protein 1 RNA binding domain-containing protein n=1 Tax=Apiosordaria backusii TaxID=314023 RepID=A0AA40F052_9PEZI|nr:hypothetical protein B0T21DRAFT_447481 [Apiosordaria backusii]